MTKLTTLSGTAVSPFAFGTMQFGGKADATNSEALYDLCRDAGITHFDTAHAYTDGRSETLLGGFARSEREKVLIASKAGYTGGASKANIQTTFDQSRKRLGMDVIDLFYMHRFDDETPLEETFETLAALQSSGGIRYIGVSNYAAWQVMKAQCAAARFGTRIDVIQPMYNLVKRQAEVELLPMCDAEGILPCVYSPLGGGLLTGKYIKQSQEGRLIDDSRYAARYAVETMHDAAATLATIAQDHGTHPATLAIAWIIRNHAACVPILSGRSTDQLKPSLAGRSFALDDAVNAQLSALAPTPPPATDRLEEA